MRTNELKSLREKLGDSQWDFARRLGINQATISRWEAGRIPKNGPARFAIQMLVASLRQTEAAE